MQQRSNTLYKEILGGRHYYGKVWHPRQFFSVAMPYYPFCLAPPAITLRLRHSVSPSQVVYPSPSLFSLFPSPLTLRLCSPNSLFLLLVFVFASQSHASRSYCSSCFLPTLFNQPLALFRRRYSLSSSFSPHTCTRVVQVRGQRLARVEWVLACACLWTHESHVCTLPYLWPVPYPAVKRVIT